MSLSLGGQLITNQTQLSHTCQLVLGLLEGGIQWFAWAVTSPTERYSFADEAELLSQLQQRLHASDFMLLPRLQLLISPVTLLSLGVDDLQLLAAVEAGDESAVSIIKARALLAAHGLLTRDDLALLRTCLEELGVSSMPLFQAPGLSDSLALHKLLVGENGTILDQMQEAADFAVQQATTPREFCDYCRFYLDLAAADTTDTTPSARSQKAMAVFTTLAPLVFGALDCPQLSGSASPMEIRAVISSLNAQQKLLGFSSVARAVQQVARHTGFPTTASSTTAQAVQQYLLAAQTFLGAANRNTARLEQDATVVVRLEGDTQYAELCLDSSGMLWLSEFGVRGT